MNKCTQKGLALVTVLLLLAVLALYSLYAMQNSVLETKIVSVYHERQQLVLFSESILSEIEAAVQFKVPACYVQANSELASDREVVIGLSSPLSCTGNSGIFQYYYKVEALPQQACIFLYEFNQKVPVDLLRISLLVVMNDYLHARRVVQSTIVKSAQLSQPCNAAIRMLVKGRQTFREIVV